MYLGVTQRDEHKTQFSRIPYSFHEWNKHLFAHPRLAHVISFLLSDSDTDVIFQKYLAISTIKFKLNLFLF